MNTILRSCLFIVMIVLLSTCDNDPKISLQTSQMSDNPLPECPDSPNCYRSTYSFEADSNAVFDATSSVLEEIGVHELEIVENDSVNKIDAVFRIPVFGYLDDVAILIEPKYEGTGTNLYIRSASREGYSDLGVNKRRVKKIIRKLERELNSN